MNFGIMSSQMEILLPTGDAPQNFLAHLSQFSHASLIRTIAESGFKTIELSGDLEMLLPHFYTPAALAEVAQTQQEYDLEFTVHLPLWSVETSTLLPAVRQGSIAATIEHIQKTAVLEPTVYVLHATGALAAEFYRMRLPNEAKNYLLSQFQQNAADSIRQILEKTGLASRAIAIETIEFPFDRTCALAEELDLSICFDTGHILAGFSGEIDFFEAFERVRNRLSEIHLHDCPLEEAIGYGKDHQALGKGDLDLKKFYAQLSKTEFNGPVIFELSVADALASSQTWNRMVKFGL